MERKEIQKNNRSRAYSLWLLSCISLFFAYTLEAQASYRAEGTAFYAFPDHYIGTNYSLEGTAFYAFTVVQTGALPVYRFYNITNGGHFYTISEAEKNDVATNMSETYHLEGIAFYAYPDTSTDSSSLPVYRFYNSSNGQHFYTASETEKNSLTTNLSSIFHLEGIAFYVYITTAAGLSPIYRFYNSANADHFYTADQNEVTTLENLSKKVTFPVYRFVNLANGQHFFTISESEKDFVQDNQSKTFGYEGIAFYAYPDSSSDSALAPVYRFLNLITGEHFYTISEAEKTSVVANLGTTYKLEGIAFYAYPSLLTGTSPIYRFVSSSEHFYTISTYEYNYLVTSGLGFEIPVGLWYYSASSINSSPFQIDANKPYNIKDEDGNLIAQIGANSTTSVTYADNGNLQVSGPIANTIINSTVNFDASDGDNTDLIFNVHRPSSSYDHYRGKIKIQYYRGLDIINSASAGSSNVTQIWVINTLPLEQYTWGMGETTGTGNIEHTKVMTTIFRTYGDWYIQYATKYVPYGFKIRSDSGSQIYKGYDWETSYPNIQKAAQATSGAIATYGSEVALTPYSSWSDGRTRSFQERWGSTSYPWCQSVSDPYGKHPTMTTTELEAAGNHMVGLVANGSVNLAANYGWDYQRIMKYYYTGISLNPIY